MDECFVIDILKIIINGIDKNLKSYVLDTYRLNSLIKHQILLKSYQFLKKDLTNINYINAVVNYNKILKSEKNILSECIRINNAFNASRIRFLIVKGIPLSIYTYGAYNKREYTDIDYVIFPDDAQKAHDILYGLGYLNLIVENGSLSIKQMKEASEFYPSHYYPYTNTDNQVGVELHTRLPETSPEDFQDFYNRRVDIYLDDASSLPTLDLHDTFLCLLNTVSADDIGCANMTDEGDPGGFLQMKMRNYLDVYSFYLKYKNQLDIGKIYNLALRYINIFQCFLTLSFTADIFNTDVFDELLNSLNITHGKNSRVSLHDNIYKSLMDYHVLRRNKDIINAQHKRMLYRNIQYFRLSSQNKWYDKPINVTKDASTSEMYEFQNTSEPLKYRTLFQPVKQGDDIGFILIIERDITSEQKFVVDLSFMNPNIQSDIIEYRIDIFYNKGEFLSKYSVNEQLPDWNTLFNDIKQNGEDTALNIKNGVENITMKVTLPLKKIGIAALPVKIPYEVNIFNLNGENVELIQDMGNCTSKILEIG